ncbi:hypothetical protein JOF56_000223 [Kibdelosporangium banguiense]|uniref:CU044_5270 family protein n=1 Tax=Kibdelosporangium banguiense TaxID=1365924 RepID=A0ABS4T7J3_9PSEU|nr:hypothetical protein [Kibdelosporangium banguiense]MBP2319838.1 hypothetical protein [Kibdelosporangium banguiense]
MPDVDDPEVDGVDSIVRAVLADTPRMTEESFAAGRERVLAQRRKPRQWLRIASVAAGVALVATTALFIPSSDTELAETASAASVLDRAASLVRDPDLMQNQFRYVSLESTSPPPLYYEMPPSSERPPPSSKQCDSLPMYAEQTWIPRDPAAEWFQLSGVRQVSGKVGDEVKCDFRTTDRAAEHGAFATARPNPPPAWEILEPKHAAGLPRDPEAMYRKLSASVPRANPSLGNFLLFVSRGFMLPADMRATLLRATKYLPGVTVTQESVTIDGRTGIAVGLPAKANGGAQQDIVIDPKDGSLIAYRRFVDNQKSIDVFTYGVAEKSGEKPRG